MSPYLSWTEDLPSKQTADSSRTPGDAKTCRNRKILARFLLLEAISKIYGLRIDRYRFCSLIHKIKFV